MLDSRKMKLLYNKNKFTIVAWAACMITVLFVYHLLSDGDFSFLLTLGSLTNAFGFVILVVKMRDQKNASGISLKTLEVYALVYIARLCSILFHEGYLPYDASGDWLYQVIEVLSLALVGALIFHILKVYNTTYDEKEDAFGNLRIPSQFGAVYAIIPSFVLAVLFHPNLNNSWFADTMWSFAMTLETVAVMPQLFLFQKKGGEVEAFTSNYVATLGLSRVLQFIFWVSSFSELNDHHVRFAGPYVLLCQVVQLLIVADYLYFYIKSVRSGGPMRLPTNANNV